jgi:sulfur-oxidizing protein SoxZ
MQRMAKGIVFAPKSARRGEVIEIRATAQHPMETGYRAAADGSTLPRDLVRRVECRWGGELVFAADLHAAIAANPYVAFHAVASASGPLTVRWQGDRGFDLSETVQIEVA